MTTSRDPPHVQVTAALIWKAGRVLVAQRPKGAHLEGLWEFPGGKQEEGETLESCLEREIAEELGMRVRAEERLLTVHHRYESKRISLHAFRCRWIGGEPRALQCQALRWVSPLDLAEMPLPPPDRKLVEILFRGI